MISGDVALFEGELLLAEDSLQSAIAFLRQRPLPPLPRMNSPQLLAYNVPFTRDVLARAYARAREPDSAFAEYRRLLRTDPGSTDRRMTHSLYHYRLTKLLESKGVMKEAIGEYREFLDIWKDADSSLPEPTDARERLALLLRQ
jgi:tetratricopeptide (TPR) repeat protein